MSSLFPIYFIIMEQVDLGHAFLELYNNDGSVLIVCQERSTPPVNYFPLLFLFSSLIIEIF